MTTNQSYYLVQTQVQQDGEWYDCRGDNGILVFLNEIDAIMYMDSPDFEKLKGYTVQVRVVETRVIKTMVIEK